MSTPMHSMRPRFKAALFDLDDTLFDHQLHRREALTALRETAGIAPAVTIEQLENEHDEHLQSTYQLLLAGQLSIAQARTERMRSMLQAFGAGHGDAEVQLCEDLYRAVYDRRRRAIPGAIDLVDALKAAGVWIGIVTNGGSPEQRAKIEALDLARRADGIFISAELGCEKPSREFFGRALGAANVAAHECIVVGDLWPTDIQGALNAGCEAVWLNRYQRTAGPHPRVREIRSLEPLADVLSHFMSS
jgi:putative hydrolase of the HAD superfamily